MIVKVKLNRHYNDFIVVKRKINKLDFKGF